MSARGSPIGGNTAVIITIAAIIASGLFATSNIWTGTQTFNNINLKNGGFPYTTLISLYPANSNQYCTTCVVYEKNHFGLTIMSSTDQQKPIADAISRGGTIWISNGTYYLPSNFTGFSVPAYTKITMDKAARIIVPTGYTGAVFKFTTSGEAYSEIVGGRILENGTVQRAWTAILFNGQTSPNGIFENTVDGVYVQDAGTVIAFNATHGKWVNSNTIKNVHADHSRKFTEWNYTGAFVIFTDGFNRNYFTNNYFEANAVGVTHYGFKNIGNGIGNDFEENRVFDLTGSDISTSINKNASSTFIRGGVQTALNYQDNGSLTSTCDQSRCYFSSTATKLSMMVSGHNSTFQQKTGLVSLTNSTGMSGDGVTTSVTTNNTGSTINATLALETFKYVQSGNYYSFPSSSTPAGAAMGSNSSRVFPLPIGFGFGINLIQFQVTTATTATNNFCEVGIYNSSASTRLPMTLVANSSNIDVTSTGLKNSTISFSFKSNQLYYMGYNCKNSVSLNAVGVTDTTFTKVLGYSGHTGMASFNSYIANVNNLGSGKYPLATTFSGGVLTSGVSPPLIEVRAR